MIEVMLEAATRASEKILPFFRGSVSTHLKPDASPVTEADIAASEIIASVLKNKFSQIPQVDEEREKLFPGQQEFFLIDPLDGTKEFLAGRADFTVNIAYVKNGVPEKAVVMKPASGEVYWAERGKGAFKAGRRLICSGQEGLLRVVCSRSHQTAAEKTWIESLKNVFPEIRTEERGSSLKILAIAEGAADFYPRLGPTCQWDIAAAQGILREAGGEVISLATRGELSYGHASPLNSMFFAARKELTSLLLQHWQAIE